MPYQGPPAPPSQAPLGAALIAMGITIAVLFAAVLGTDERRLTTERRLVMRIEDIEQKRRRDARALAAIINQTGATLEAIPAAIRQQVDRKDAARRPM
jgi:hypothetical protein